jgi:hypothetical protein
MLLDLVTVLIFDEYALNLFFVFVCCQFLGWQLFDPEDGGSTFL